MCWKEKRKALSGVGVVRDRDVKKRSRGLCVLFKYSEKWSHWKETKRKVFVNILKKIEAFCFVSLKRQTALKIMRKMRYCESFYYFSVLKGERLEKAANFCIMEVDG